MAEETEETKAQVVITPEHEADLKMIADKMHALAKRHSWCPGFWDAVDELNTKLHGELPTSTDKKPGKVTMYIEVDLPEVEYRSNEYGGSVVSRNTAKAITAAVREGVKSIGGTNTALTGQIAFTPARVPAAAKKTTAKKAAAPRRR